MTEPDLFDEPEAPDEYPDDSDLSRLTPYARQCLDEAREALKRPADRRTA